MVGCHGSDQALTLLPKVLSSAVDLVIFLTACTSDTLVLPSDRSFQFSNFVKPCGKRLTDEHFQCHSFSFIGCQKWSSLAFF